MMNEGPEKTTLANFVKKTKTCRQYVEYIDKNYKKIAEDKMHATVGFGFYSNSYGLSEGLPVDIYTMLLCAESLRQKVLAEGAKVTIVIGDHFAFKRCNDHNKVIEIREKYLKKLNNILKNLGVEEHYEILKSSEIVEGEAYQTIFKEVKKRAKDIESFEREGNEAPSHNGYAVGLDTWYMVKHDDEDEDDELGGIKNYFLEQTALFKYLYEKGCGVKVSWARSAHKKNITHSTSYDEAHFDRFYRELFFDEPEKLSFIYTEAGYSIDSKAKYSSVVPYTAPKMCGERVLLRSKQNIPDEAEIVDKKFVAVIRKNVDLLEEIKCEIKMLNGYPHDFCKSLLLLKEMSRKTFSKESESDDFKQNKTLKVKQ